MLLEEALSTDASSSQSRSSTEHDAPTPSKDRVALLGATAVAALGWVLSYGALQVANTAFSLALSGMVGVVVTLTLVRRLTAPWIGAMGWTTACVAATTAVHELGDTGYDAAASALMMVAIVGALPISGWLWHRRAQDVSLTDACGQATRVFLAPSTALAPVLVGGGMALPLLGAYGTSVTDPDSAWVVSSSQIVRADGIGLLEYTQEVSLPYLTISPLLAVGGLGAGVLFSIGTLIALVGLTAYLGWRVTNHGAGAFAAAATLLAMPMLTYQVDRLPMYAGTFLLAYGAGWMLHRAMADPPSRRWLPVLAGLGFAAAYEAHALGQIFLAVPFLLLLLHPWHRARRPLFTALATTAAALIPRLLINLPAENLSELRSNRADFLVQQGYLDIINRDFNGQNVDVSPLGYLTNVPHMAEGAIGGRGMLFIVMIPVTYAALRAHHRALMFAIATTGLFAASLAAASPATYDRYMAPLGAGIAVAVSVGACIALRGQGAARSLGRIMIAMLLAAAFLQMSDVVTERSRQREALAEGPLPDIVNLADDGRAVLGNRSHELSQVDPTLPILFQRMMPEEDYVTFLTWPSDEAVTDMMDRLDIGWVLVKRDLAREVYYHQTWLERTYDDKVRHVVGLSESPEFCLAADSPNYWLYRYGDCQPGDPGLLGTGGPNDPAVDPFRAEAGTPLVRPELDADDRPRPTS